VLLSSVKPDDEQEANAACVLQDGGGSHLGSIFAPEADWPGVQHVSTFCAAPAIFRLAPHIPRIIIIIDTLPPPSRPALRPPHAGQPPRSCRMIVLIQASPVHGRFSGFAERPRLARVCSINGGGGGGELSCNTAAA